MPDFAWMKERIEKVPKANWLYRVLCFLTGRRKSKMTYEEMYLFLREMNNRGGNEAEVDKMAFKRVLEIYKFQNKNIPISNV